MTGLAIGGFMGSGKSTVGALLAERLGLPFVDLDRAVEEEAGATVEVVFQREGEVGFRQREARVLRALLDGPDAVLALGGGTLHHGDNLDRLRERSRVVVLDLPWEELAPRLARQGGRPLAGQGQALWTARREGYRAAGLLVDVGGLTPEAAVSAVLERL